MRSALIILLCLTLNGINEAATTAYSNNNYGFAVSVPRGFPVQYDEPPAPDHGSSVTLGTRREIIVFADCDVLLDGSATSALRRSLSYEHWPAKAPVRQTRLAGLPAASAEIKIGERRVIRVVAFRSYDGQTPVLYHLYLDTDATHAAQDRGVFRSILRGFTLQPLPD